MNLVSSKRMVLPDVLKGLGIILVVMGHNIQFGSGREYLADDRLFFGNFLFKLIYTFHMPLFMLISGYFFSMSAKRHTIREICRSRFYKIFVPMAMWNLVHFLVTIIRGLKWAEYPYPLHCIRVYFETFVKNWWFLWALLIYSVLMIPVLKIKNSLCKAVYLLCIFALMHVTPDSYSFNCYKYCSIYFVTGFYWHHLKLQDTRFISWFRKNDLIALILFSGIFVLMFPFMTRDTYAYTTGVTLLSKDVCTQIYNNTFRWIIGYVGCICFILFVKIIISGKENSKVVLELSKIGRNTIGIYIISGLFENYCMPKLTSKLFFNPVILLLETVLLMLFCGIVIKGIRKNEKASKLLLGD